MKVLSGESREPREQPHVRDTARDAWLLVASAGVIFLVVGGLDTVLTFIPSAFGTTEWEFGTVTASLNGLPLPVLGAALLAGAGLVRGWRKVVRTLAVGMILVALAVLALGVIYLTTLPQALSAAQQAGGIGTIGIKRAMVKTLVQLVAYPVGLAVMATLCWRFTRVRGS